MKDSVKKGIVVTAPAAMGFFGGACLNVSTRSSGNAFTDTWVGMLLVSVEKPSVKKGLIGGGIGLGFGLCMYMLIQYCTAEARQKSRDYQGLESKWQEAEQHIQDLLDCSDNGETGLTFRAI